MTNHKLIVGNVVDALKTIPDESVDLVCTSPPYWGLRDYGDVTKTQWIDGWFGQLGLEPDYRLYVNHMVEICKDIKRVLKKTGSFYLNLGDSYNSKSGSGKIYANISNVDDSYGVSDFRQNHMGNQGNIPVKCLMKIPQRVELRLIDELGFTERNDIIWYKKNYMPSPIKDRLTNAYEHMFHFVKAKKYFYDLDAIRVPNKVVGVTDMRPPNVLRQKLYPKSEYNKSGDQHLSQFKKQDNVPSKNAATYQGFNQRWKNSQQYAVQERTKEFIEVRNLPDLKELSVYLNENRKYRDLSIDEVEKLMVSQSPHHWFNAESYPTVEDWGKIKEILLFDDKYDKALTEVFLKPAEKQNHPNGKNPGDVIEEDWKYKMHEDSPYKNIGERKAYARRMEGKDHDDCLNHPKGKNPGDVFNEATASFSGAHFACVSEDTECLTIDGWKKYNEIKRGNLIASYDLETQKIRFIPCSYIKTYNVDTNLIKVGNRDLDILMTTNHRNIVKKRSGEEKIVIGESITYNDKIRVYADFDIKEYNSIGVEFAELIGWIITEGHYSKDGSIRIYQNEGKNADRIRKLLKPFEYTENVRRKNQITWYIKKSSSKIIKSVLPEKKLNTKLIFLSKPESLSLFNSLISGDGHKRVDDKRILFTQKNKETVDLFSILAMRLGYSVIISKRKDINIYQVYLTKRTHIGIRGSNGKGKNIQKINYKGVVWCPKTKYGTWVARRNGRIFITGNTYPEKLIIKPILSSCPVGGTVLDPFAGSGTTAKVSRDNNRNSISIDINPNYEVFWRKKLNTTESLDIEYVVEKL